jgi:hypothetical protein
VAHELEARMPVQMIDVPLGAREQIIDAQDFMILIEKPIDEVRAQESGAPGYQDPFAAII